MNYIPSLDLFMDEYGTYSCEAMDAIDREEKMWNDSRPEFSVRYLIEAFPTATNLLKKKLEREIADAERDIREADRLEKIYADIVYIGSSKKDEEFWTGLYASIFLEPLRKGREKSIRTNLFHISGLNGHAPSKGQITDSDIENAKGYPIESLIKFNHAGKAVCLWHEEKTPSLHFYRKGNRVRCFGCNRAEDAIGVYRALFNVDFIAAVKALSGKNA